jgi:hypothetical protein
METRYITILTIPAVEKLGYSFITIESTVVNHRTQTKVKI